ncbi:MAG: hypothetical protein AMXMBFR33_62570 [Candidatus Xenobia bacterium]
MTRLLELAEGEVGNLGQVGAELGKGSTLHWPGLERGELDGRRGGHFHAGPGEGRLERGRRRVALLGPDGRLTGTDRWL